MKTPAFENTQDWASPGGKNHAMPRLMSTDHLVYEAATVLAAGLESLEDLLKISCALQLCIELQQRAREGQLDRKQRRIADELFLLCSEVSAARSGLAI